jgi:hypothetical protein
MLKKGESLISPTIWKNLTMQDRSLNRSQAIVVVIGLGLALWVLGGWLTDLGSNSPVGSMTYGPFSTGDAFGGFHPWLRLIIWLLVIAVWVRSSTALLSTKSSERHRDGDS